MPLGSSAIARAIVLAGLLSCLVLAACNLGMTATPTSRDVERWYPEIHFEEGRIIGVYVNYDTDAMIFRYEVKGPEARALFSRIVDSALGNGWRASNGSNDPGADRVRLVRLDHPSHLHGDLHSIEVMQIALCESGVVVGGVQRDAREVPSEGKMEDPESWAASHFWPLFESQVARSCTGAASHS